MEFYGLSVDSRAASVEQLGVANWQWARAVPAQDICDIDRIEVLVHLSTNAKAYEKATTYSVEHTYSSSPRIDSDQHSR
jgi:hypothetical protein